MGRISLTSSCEPCKAHVGIGRLVEHSNISVQPLQRIVAQMARKAILQYLDALQHVLDA